MTEAFAKNQIRRCAGMPGQPTDDVAIKERIKALMNCSRSEQHAQRIMDSLVSTLQFFPTVADIRQASEYVSGESVPNGCAVCHGDPYIVVERNGCEGAARCTCERGRYLSARDRERAA